MLEQGFPYTLVVCFISLVFFVRRSQAQAITDPAEVRALNSMFSHWNISSSMSVIPWNLTGDPCTGGAIAGFQVYSDPKFNPGIFCDCSSNNSTCHITAMRADTLNMTGTIAGELESLTHLTVLQVEHNYLTGPLPAFIGNLTQLKYLSVGANLLSGSIPKELGNLQNLILLGIGINNFSGTFPPELGNLTNLEHIYMDSSGVGGEMPPTFAQLLKLKTIAALDNGFTGKIPDFIGNFTSLERLYIQGNYFQGPIPSSFVQLTKLTDLQIGDLSNGSSSLAFIQNMKSLTTLILRNSEISDTIPSNIGEYTSLEHLDLSFNNIAGTLPQSLFNINSLVYLFLGNNSLSGNLPDKKSAKLLNVDLSYNQLSGSFPPWVSEENLKVNLVANDFLIDGSDGSSLPSGLNCLQRNIPCGSGSPSYYSFAVQCGRNTSITSSDGTSYEKDDIDLGAASYYVTDEKRWAVSSVGKYPGATSQLRNILYSDPFTARISQSSLRYYGLGLENGNYTIKLQFVELVFPNDGSWLMLGRRKFDIYIQGILVEKSFDIRKQAGGLSHKAFEKEYVAPVTNNFLEIHLFWAGKGTCCVPTGGYQGPLVSAISVFPFDFRPTVSNQRPTTERNKKKTGLIVGVASGLSIFLALVIGTFLWRGRRKKRSLNNKEGSNIAFSLNQAELVEVGSRALTFSYAVLRTATEDFSPANKLGKGGFGVVYKGKLSDGRMVAVKQLLVASDQGNTQFMAEIAAVSAVHHRNLVTLYGCCIEGGKRLLVYEYLENRSLDQALFGHSNLNLDWGIRFEICLETARGLAYLHEESSPRIIHRDVKASNILLDACLKPKIADFGIAKLYDNMKTHITTRVAGTIGYLAPEYAMKGHLSEKVDVYSFGVVTLELLSGRQNTEQRLDEETYLLEWAWQLHEEKCELELMDPKLSSYNSEEANRAIRVALLCIQASPTLRPAMSRVVAMLAGNTEVAEATSKPGYLTDLPYNVSVSTFTGDDSLGDSTVTSIAAEVYTPNTEIGQDPSTSQSPTLPMLYQE